MAKANSNARVLLPYRHAKKLRAYEDALRAAGMEPVPGFVGESISLNGFAGLLLMGGTDVNPSRYGEEPQPETDEPDDQRDETELRLIDEAIAKDLPILAICRGLQILNVYHGGTLIQHLSPTEPHDPRLEDKSAPAHEVAIEPDSRLAQIAGATRWRVNSRHHQGAAKIGERLRVSARATEDGVVEGLERRDKRFVVAVQWHPEDQVPKDREQLKLFRAFAEALEKSLNSGLFTRCARLQ
jgi:putative glutamine amidotransferase